MQKLQRALTPRGHSLIFKYKIKTIYMWIWMLYNLLSVFISDKTKTLNQSFCISIIFETQMFHLSLCLFFFSLRWSSSVNLDYSFIFSFFFSLPPHKNFQLILIMIMNNGSFSNNTKTWQNQ